MKQRKSITSREIEIAHKMLAEGTSVIVISKELSRSKSVVARIKKKWLEGNKARNSLTLAQAALTKTTQPEICLKDTIEALMDAVLLSHPQAENLTIDFRKKKYLIEVRTVVTGELS